MINLAVYVPLLMDQHHLLPLGLLRIAHAEVMSYLIINLALGEGFFALLVERYARAVVQPAANGLLAGLLRVRAGEVLSRRQRSGASLLTRSF